MDHAMHSMGTIPMATATSTGAMSTSTSSMDMHDMHGGMSGCQISMLWNWTTIDACFLSSSWHITSRGMFAGSCIGVICLVLSLEFLRRVAREYDAFIVRRARLRAQYFTLPAASQTTSQSQSESQSPKQSTANVVASSSTAITSPDGAKGIPPCDVQAVRPTMVEQLVRAALHMLQFAVAYFVMLLAMYFNGYIIICIFIGAFLGSFLFSWEPLGLGKENDATAVTKCCG